MSEWQAKVRYPGPSPEAEEMARSYEDLGGLLLRTLTDRFGVPEEDAGALLHEMFIAYLTLGGPLQDPESWFIAATFASAAAYRRTHTHIATTPVPLLRDALSTLPTRTREAVRLRFYENLSYAEIAAELGVTQFYARNLIQRAMAQLRKLRREQEPAE